MQLKVKMLAILFFVSSVPLLAQTYGWVKVAKLPYGLSTVEFVDPLHGWTADGKTGFYYTRDGGITWAPAPGATVQPYSISMYDSMVGYATGWSGSFSGIYHTINGGTTWIEQIIVQNRHYLGTFTYNPQKNTTVGGTIDSHPDTGKFVTTTNGGTTWIETTPFDSGGAYNKIQFVDSLHGWIVGAFGSTLLQTKDGGNTWQILPYRPQIQVATFLDTLLGWGGYQNSMFHTTDGGVSWQYRANLDQPDQLSMRDVEFVDSLKGWAFGGMFYSGIISEGIFRTTDGGANWTLESIGLTGDFDVVMDAQMFSDHAGIAVCNRGSVLRYQVVTSVAEKLPEQVNGFSLSQNYPNPFNPTTNIEYEINREEYVTLIVYDALGKNVTTVIDQRQEAGRYRVRFDGSSHPSGVYYYTLKTDSYSETKQMLLVK